MQNYAFYIITFLAKSQMFFNGIQNFLKKGDGLYFHRQNMTEKLILQRNIIGKIAFFKFKLRISVLLEITININLQFGDSSFYAEF